jgi:hypothetical protein
MAPSNRWDVSQWKHLDGWDLGVFLVGLPVGFAVGLYFWPHNAWVVGQLGLALGVGGIALRRVLVPSVLERESKPEPPEFSTKGLVLLALGVFCIPVALVGGLLAAAVCTVKTNPPAPLLGRVAFVLFPLLPAAGAVCLIRAALRARKR